ncbi:MAG: hypothetical protein QF752_04110 [Planctomycetota bacterium]|nr:hypothetical protein [Planctomycetota bacterium]
MKKKTLFVAVGLILSSSPALASLLPVLDGDQLTVVREDGRVIHVANEVSDRAFSAELVAYRKRGRLRLINREGNRLFLSDRVAQYAVGDNFLAIRKEGGHFQMVSSSGQILTLSTGVTSFRLVRVQGGSDFVILSRKSRTQVVTAMGQVVSIRKRRDRTPKIGIVVEYPSR